MKHLARMSNKPKPALVPKLRFPAFRDAEEWKETQLQKIAQPVSDRAVTGGSDNVLSLSGEQGLVLQSDYFGKKIAGDSAERYLKLLRDDFVYNDRTTKASIYGTIKRLSKYSGGIVSPIYKCFRFNSGENPVFWEWYFESGTHDDQLVSLVNEGARAGRFNISISQFLSTAAWHPKESEQQKIAECLNSVDELIAAQTQKLEALKTHKKGLMQQLFPRAGETQPRLRFPEFRGMGWEEKKIGAILVDTPRPIEMDDETQYSLVTVKRRYGGVVSREILKGKNIKVKSQFIVDANDFLISKRQIVHNACGLVPDELRGSIVSNEYSVLTPHKGCDIRFFNFFAQQPSVSQSFMRASVGIVIEKMLFNLNSWLNREFPFPLFEEQQRIAACLTSLDDVISAHTQKLAALKLHKRGLMQQLFPAPEVG